MLQLILIIIGSLVALSLLGGLIWAIFVARFVSGIHKDIRKDWAAFDKRSPWH